MRREIQKIVLTSLFIALGIILPAIFHSFSQDVAKAISPMHFPVLICGLLLGWKYGLACGVITPLLASFIQSSPPLIPMALTMSFELATYGLITGLLYNEFNIFRRKIDNLIFSLVVAMIIGRIVFALVLSILPYIFNNVSSESFWSTVISLFVGGIIGIILQLLIVPSVVFAIEKLS